MKFFWNKSIVIWSNRRSSNRQWIRSHKGWCRVLQGVVGIEEGWRLPCMCEGWWVLGRLRSVSLLWWLVPVGMVGLFSLGWCDECVAVPWCTLEQLKNECKSVKFGVAHMKYCRHTWAGYLPAGPLHLPISFSCLESTLDLENDSNRNLFLWPLQRRWWQQGNVGK